MVPSTFSLNLNRRQGGRGIARGGERSGDGAVPILVAKVGEFAVKSVKQGMVARYGSIEGGGSVKGVVGMPSEIVVEDPVRGGVVQDRIVDWAMRVAVSGIGSVSIGKAEILLRAMVEMI